MIAARHLSLRVWPISVAGFTVGNRRARNDSSAMPRAFGLIDATPKSPPRARLPHAIAIDLGRIPPKTVRCPPAEMIKSP